VEEKNKARKGLEERGSRGGGLESAPFFLIPFLLHLRDDYAAFCSKDHASIFNNFN